MFRKENLVLTYASGKNLFESESFFAFVNSSKLITNGDVVIITHDIPDHNRDYCESNNISVIDFPPAFMKYLYRDRHYAFWDYLNNHGYKYKYVLVTDSRDVVFQDNPFDWIPIWQSRYKKIHGEKNFLKKFVVLTAEGHKMQQSGFSCIDQFEFEKDIPESFRKTDKNRYVINGGVFLGTPRELQNWHYLIWMSTLKTIGRCTDQATINWILYHLENDDTYQISFPQTDNLCMTGEGIKEGAVTTVIKDDGLVYNNKNEKYFILHQWDRIDSLKEKIISRLGSNEKTTI